MKNKIDRLFEINIILKVLKWLLVAVMVITVYMITVHIHESWHDARPLCELLMDWRFLKYLLIACFSLLTLYVAGYQLKKQTDMACIAALAELRQQLTNDRNRNVHYALMDEKEQVR